MNVRVLNLGAGVQSTAIYLRMIDGDIPACDYAVFADTGDEPREVYDHVERLRAAGGPEIVTVTTGNLGDNLINGMNATGQRHISIPTFLAVDDESAGIGRRQCTKEYKIVPIERAIRLETSACTRGMRGKQYLHRSCKPLEEVEFKPSPPDQQKRMQFSQMDCEGMCGV